MQEEEMIELLDKASIELMQAKSTLDEVFEELNKMYEENEKLQKNLNIAKFLINNLAKRNEELEKENKFFKERLINA